MDAIEFKILVVEDSEPVLQNICTLLSMSGYKAISAVNGNDGLTKAKENVPDLIIADIAMPELNGLEMIQKIKNDPLLDTIPFIFLTARSNMDDLRTGMEAGADDYIAKPYKAVNLMKSVSVQLKKNQARKRMLEELRQNIILNVPHELRTPLVSILGNSQLITDFKGNLEMDEIYGMVENINKSGKRLQRVIEKFIRVAELETKYNDAHSKAEIHSMHVESADEVIMENALSTADKLYRRKDLEMDIKNFPIKIHEPHLAIIITELVENACIFSLPGSKIKIKAERNEDKYQVEIINEGIGLTTEQVKKIGPFMQFSRDDYSHPGNGMGLFTVKKIAELHDATIEIKSNPGDCTKVSVSIPLLETKELEVS